MSTSVELSDTRSQSQGKLTYTSNLSGSAKDKTVSDSTSRHLNHPSHLESGATAGPGDPPHRQDTTGLTEMEEGRVAANEKHEYTDVSQMALHQRIAALERSQVLLHRRITELETVTAKKPQATFTPWRVLNSVLILGLGGYKAIAAHQRQTIVLTTADWIIGVVWTLMCFIEVPIGHPLMIQRLAIQVGSSLVTYLESCIGLVVGLQTTINAIVPPENGMHIAVRSILGAIIGGGMGAGIAWVLDWGMPHVYRALPTLRELLSKQESAHDPSSWFDASDWSIANPVGFALACLFHFVWDTFGFIQMAYRLLTRLALYLRSNPVFFEPSQNVYPVGLFSLERYARYPAYNAPEFEDCGHGRIVFGSRRKTGRRQLAQSGTHDILLYEGDHLGRHGPEIRKTVMPSLKIRRPIFPLCATKFARGNSALALTKKLNGLKIASQTPSGLLQI
ncbi:hypothetical protein K438DRAFT_1935459 [Mycena galopus ATCC 62051]|nr:hypothetical protein K438DRAFT_1935459 [Mycena galopus ATCC 62051]